MATRGVFARATWARGVFPHQLAWLIDNPMRRLLVAPDELVARLELTATDRVLEIGPGSGYFSSTLAQQVPRGRLELFDLQPEMLHRARRKLERRGHRDVGYTVGDAGVLLPYADASFDIVVMVSVLGEVRDQTACLDAIHRVLRESGSLVIHESIPDPDRISWKDLVRLVEPRGFSLTRRVGPAWNYTATFAPLPERSEERSG